MGSACRNPFRSAANKAPKSCRSARDGEGRFRIIQNQRRTVLSPLADLLANSFMQQFRAKRAAVEENGVNGRTIPQKICQVPCDGTVRGVGKSPFPQCDLRPVRTRARMAL